MFLWIIPSAPIMINITVTFISLNILSDKVHKCVEFFAFLYFNAVIYRNGEVRYLTRSFLFVYYN